MPIKVQIAEGKGRVSCTLPGFHLDEVKRPFVIVEEITAQLSDLETRGLVKIAEVTDGNIEKMLKKASKRFTEKARERRIAELELEKETGGVGVQVFADGVIASKEPAALTRDEVRQLARAELKAIKTGDRKDLDNLIGNTVDESDGT